MVCRRGSHWRPRCCRRPRWKGCGWRPRHQMAPCRKWYRRWRTHRGLDSGLKCEIGQWFYIIIHESCLEKVHLKKKIMNMTYTSANTIAAVIGSNAFHLILLPSMTSPSWAPRRVIVFVKFTPITIHINPARSIALAG